AQAHAWDGGKGACWAAHAEHFDRTVAARSEPSGAAPPIAAHDPRQRPAAQPYRPGADLAACTDRLDLRAAVDERLVYRFAVVACPPGSGLPYAIEQGRYPVIAIACAQFWTAPVLARDNSPAQCRSAGAGHGEIVHAAAGGVVAGDFFAGRNGLPGCQGIGVNPPEVRVAAVVAVVVGLARRQDQVKVLGNGDRVHIRLPGL